MLNVELLVDECIVIETLTRLGVADKKNKKLYQSCYLMKTDTGFSLFHFKELFFLRDGICHITEEDWCRLNSIAVLLEEWNLINILNLEEDVETTFVYCLPYSQKNNWTLINKFKVGTL